MKILVVGDLHMRRELPYGSALPDGRRGEWEEVKEVIHAAAVDCDMVVLMGDNLNSRNNHSTVLREFVEFLNDFRSMGVRGRKIYILAGNHEQYLGGTAIDFLKEIQTTRWEVITEPTSMTIGNKEIAFVPYIREKNGYVESLVGEGGVSVLFAHNVADTAKGWVAEEYTLPTEWLKRHSDMTFYGHNHNEEEISPNIQGTGSCFTAQIGETERAIWTYDTDTKTTTRIPLPVRPIIAIDWKDSTYYDLPTNAIVKCRVTVKGTDLELVKNTLSRFDAAIIVEDYADERVKVHFESGALDLSVESLLQKYAEVRGIDYQELLAGLDLIR